MKTAKTLTFALLAACVLAFPHPAAAAENFIYELIPGKNIISWTLLSDEGNRQIFAGVSGRLGFTVNDDSTVSANLFDLTLEGPFYDDLLNPPADAPFAPGDKLADLIVGELDGTGGIVVRTPGLNGNPPGPRQAHVGPQVSGDWQVITAGFTYYTLANLDAPQTLLFLDAAARPEIGGSFRLFPPGESPPPGPNGLVHPILLLLPNAQRVPEPGAATLAIAALAMIARRRSIMSRAPRRG